MENEQFTKEMEQQNKEKGLPIFKNMEKKGEEKPMVFN